MVLSTKNKSACPCPNCQGWREAIQIFFKIWNKRAKYHFTDRVLVAAVRELRQTIEGQ